MSSRILTIQGLQYGSEAKGAIALMAALKWHPDTAACAWQPNAGHTVILAGRTYVHRMLPVSALVPSVQAILIGPGATVDLERLHREVEEAGMLLQGKTLIIHPNAAVLHPSDSENEAALVSIGSTMKGSMRAQVRKMERGAVFSRQERPAVVGDAEILWANDVAPTVRVSDTLYDDAVDSSKRLQLEGAQGFSLGMHTSFYPYCTSRDVSTAQLLADCRVPMPVLPTTLTTIGVCRTFPIRVANRFKDGEQIGTSGGHYGDQHELSWSDLGRQPELTTVTKLPRRVFTFSKKQVIAAARVMRPSAIALTFCDYLGAPASRPWGSYLPDAVRDLVGQIEGSTGVPVIYVTFGPDSSGQFQITNEAGLLVEPKEW